jgi:uncharacterized protein YyaL (SSP411 family)
MEYHVLLERAELAGRWALANQVRDESSADCGRYPRCVEVPVGRIPLASCWLQGVEIKALLALHEATGDAAYLDSCRAAARYVMTLQQTDARDPRTLGYILETTPQSREGHPRDALTSAWAMLLLHRAAPDERLMDRVRLFAEWFVRFGMDAYPFWTFYLDKEEPFRQRGSFHGGSPAFFADLFERTGESKWLDVARRIADFHVATFLKADGSLRITVTPDGTDETFQDTHPHELAWEHMHMFNDDFTALAMMKLGELTGDATYTEAGLRFCGHLLASQQADGGFGDPVVPSASPVGALSLVRAAQVDPANAAKYRAAAEKALEHVLSMQETESDDPRLRGAFYGQCARPTDGWRTFYGRRTTLHLRTSAYCTSALAMIGGRCKRTYYNVACA